METKLSQALGQPVDVQPQEMTAEENERVSFARQRYILQSQSKSVLENKFLLSKQLYEVFEQHLTIGENWNTPYRFPELFGAIQRKAADLIDNLPEAKIHATKSRAANFAIALQATLNHNDRMTNSVREKVRVLYDTLFYGTGILFEGYNKLERMVTPVTGELLLTGKKKSKVTLYDGLAEERVDPRDFFVDETATVFYDETGIQGARDCFRRRTYPYSTFLERFDGFKNVDSVVPSAWGSDGFGRGKIPYPKETQEQKTARRYVTVYEYWNVELDMVLLIANGIEIYYGSNPFKHKRLPFTFYYNYRRDDSVWGTSEVEVLAPFIYAEEEIVNLQILDNKLSLQPAIAVSGDLMFNTEETELQPGAVFTLRGLNGGKIQDNLMPLNFGGVPEGSYELVKRLEDKRIMATGDDIRALYTNPEQLATQTLAKRETAQKRVRSNVIQNTIESEKNRIELRCSNIVQFYARPYQNLDGSVSFRRIRIEGYSVKQDNDETRPEFEQQYGAQGYFSLNESALGTLEDIEIEVIDKVENDQLKKDQIDDMMKLLESALQLYQFAPQSAQGMDVVGLIKQVAKKMDVDYYEVFPSPVQDDQSDEVDLMLDLVMLGIVPTIDPEMDCIKALERYGNFKKSDVYKKSSKKVQDTLDQLITLTVQYVPQTIQRKLDIIRQYRTQQSANTNNVAANNSIPGPGSGQDVLNAAATTLPRGSQPSPQPNVPAVQTPRGVGARLGFRQAQPDQNPSQSVAVQTQ